MTPPIQQFANQQFASGKNIINHIEYDNLGRQAEEYLHFKCSNTDMAFDPSARQMSYHSTEILLWKQQQTRTAKKI